VAAELFHTDRRTDIHDEANSRFLQFCEHAHKLSRLYSAMLNANVRNSGKICNYRFSVPHYKIKQIGSVHLTSHSGAFE
jgi:hypothetical protein